MSRFGGFIIDCQSHPAFQRGWEMFQSDEPRPEEGMGGRDTEVARITRMGWDAAYQDEVSL